MRLKVKYAKLHTEYFSTGMGNLGVTLGDQQKHPGMEMWLTEVGLLCSYKKVHFMIPPGNIVGVTFVESPAGAFDGDKTSKQEEKTQAA